MLSLFFIDHVDSYRIYGKDTAEKGKFARMFEEEYQRALQELMSTFKDTAYTRFLSNPKNAPENIHDGYFSIDKKGKNVESKNKEGENEERGFDPVSYTHLDVYKRQSVSQQKFRLKKRMMQADGGLFADGETLDTVVCHV